MIDDTTNRPFEQLTLWLALSVYFLFYPSDSYLRIQRMYWISDIGFDHVAIFIANARGYTCTSILEFIFQRCIGIS